MAWTNLYLKEVPYLHNDEVKVAQNLLTKNPYGHYYHGVVDGQYGPLTASATHQAKYWLGYDTKDINSTFGPNMYRYLHGIAKLPLANQIRRKARLHAAQQVPALRARIVAELKWGINNAGSIHYGQIRPMPLKTWKAHNPHLTTDCSGSTTCAYYSAGAKDPNGYGFSGQGYTGSMLNHLPHIHPSQAQAADLVVFGSYPGEHVAAILETGADPLLFSHGQEAGPLEIRLSVEHRAHGNGPVTYLKGV